MNQMTLSDMKHSRRKRVTQKEKFLQEMNGIIPRADWVNKILPYSDHKSTEIAGIVQHFLSYSNQTSWCLFLPPADQDSRCHSVLCPHTVNYNTARLHKWSHARLLHIS